MERNFQEVGNGMWVEEVGSKASVSQKRLDMKTLCWEFFAMLSGMLHMWGLSLDQITLTKGAEGLFQDCLGFLPSANAYYD